MVFQFFNLVEDLTVAGNVHAAGPAGRGAAPGGPGTAGQLLAELGIERYGTPTPGGCAAGSGSGWRSPGR